MNPRWNTEVNVSYLSSLNTGQLRALLENEDTLQRISEKNLKLQQIQCRAELMLDLNHRLAMKNLSFKPYLKYGKRLLVKKYQLLRQLVSSVRRKEAKLVQLRRRMKHEASQIKLLQTKLIHISHQCENIWQKLLDGDLVLADFVESFQRVQTFYHAKLIQVEKMQEPCTETHQMINHPISINPIPSNFGNLIYNPSPVFVLPSSVYPVLPEIGHSAKTTHHPWTHHDDADLWTPVVSSHNTDHSETCTDPADQV